MGCQAERSRETVRKCPEFQRFSACALLRCRRAKARDGDFSRGKIDALKTLARLRFSHRSLARAKQDGGR